MFLVPRRSGGRRVVTKVMRMMIVHDKFPDDLKAELPLRRIWALVLEG